MIQSMQLDPSAVAYTDDEIVGKVNSATVFITRENAVSSPAVDLSGKSADDMAESATKKYAGVSGADFVKTIDTLEEITEGVTKKHFTETEKTKLGGVDEGATDDQTGVEIKTVYETQANTYNDTLNTKLIGIDEGAEVNPADLATLDSVAAGKLAGIEEGAKDDQTGEEVRDLVVALDELERKFIITNPITGEFKITAIQRTATGELDVDYDDVATT